jgi:hypothetical protein
MPPQNKKEGVGVHDSKKEEEYGTEDKGFFCFH